MTLPAESQNGASGSYLPQIPGLSPAQTGASAGAHPRTGPVRADSAFHSAAFAGAVRAAGAFFSVTAQMNPHVAAAIATIGQDGWTPSATPGTTCRGGASEYIRPRELRLTRLSRDGLSVRREALARQSWPAVTGVTSREVKLRSVRDEDLFLPERTVAFACRTLIPRGVRKPGVRVADAMLARLDMPG
jgi:hypothetical protein